MPVTDSREQLLWLFRVCVSTQCLTIVHVLIQFASNYWVLSMLEGLHQASRLEEREGHYLAFTENCVWWGWRATFSGQTVGGHGSHGNGLESLFFFFFFPKGNGSTLKSWSRKLMWPDLFYWKSILQNTTLRRVFTSKLKEQWIPGEGNKAKFSWVHFPPCPQSGYWAHSGFYSTYIFIQVCLKLFF